MAVENKLKFAMRDVGKSRSDIAEILKISEAAVSNKFYRDSFSADDLIKIADCLGYKLMLANDEKQIVFEISDIKSNKKDNEKVQFNKIASDESEDALNLFEQMRAEVVESDDFMTDEEINAEIQAARAERKRNRNAWQILTM